MAKYFVVLFQAESVPTIDPINGMTYSQVYEMTKDVCNKMFANPVIEEYSFHIERNDGKQWAPTDWFYFDGKKWVGRNGGKKPKRRRQGP